MKHRLTAALAAVLLLGAGIALAVGNISDTAMISKSYYEDTYLPALRENLTKRAQTASAPIYEKAEAALKGQSQAAGGTPYTSAQMGEGDELKLAAGGSLLVYNGAGRLTSGALADVTDGVSVSAGSALTAAHRYIVTDTSGATVRQTASGALGYQGTGQVTKAADQTLPFADVTAGDWFHDAVAYVYQHGYFSGTGAGTFSPNAPMDRAMVATVLYRLSGDTAKGDGTDFSDVPAGQWYSDGIAWASAQGVVNGMGNDLYAPNLAVTREQLVTMLYRYETAYRETTAAAAGSSLAKFPDQASVSDWAREAMTWAVKEGLVQGRDNGSLDPAGTATRAEVATILQRFSQRL